MITRDTTIPRSINLFFIKTIWCLEFSYHLTTITLITSQNLSNTMRSTNLTTNCNLAIRIPNSSEMCTSSKLHQGLIIKNNPLDLEMFAISFHYYKSWLFLLKILTTKYSYWTLVKKTTQSFWSSCFWHDWFDWWSFWLVEWWAIWLIKSANKNFGQQFFWVNF